MAFRIIVPVMNQGCYFIVEAKTGNIVRVVRR